MRKKYNIQDIPSHDDEDADDDEDDDATASATDASVAAILTTMKTPTKKQTNAANSASAPASTSKDGWNLSTTPPKTPAPDPSKTAAPDPPKTSESAPDPPKTPDPRVWAKLVRAATEIVDGEIQASNKVVGEGTKQAAIKAGADAGQLFLLASPNPRTKDVKRQAYDIAIDLAMKEIEAAEPNKGADESKEDDDDDITSTRVKGKKPEKGDAAMADANGKQKGGEQAAVPGPGKQDGEQAAAPGNGKPDDEQAAASGNGKPDGEQADAMGVPNPAPTGAWEASPLINGDGRKGDGKSWTVAILTGKITQLLAPDEPPNKSKQLKETLKHSIKPLSSGTWPRWVRQSGI